MFLRPFRVKSNSALKGSEKRFWRERVCSSFPNLDGSVLDIILPLKSPTEAIRLVTSSGKQVLVIFVDKQPAFFEFENYLIPAVYTLWQVPDILKFVYTWRPVYEKMMGGADLMLPGVYKPESDDTLSTFVKGEVCALGIAGSSNAVGVVTCLMSGKEMETSQMRGKGFKVLHLAGDKLWEMGSCSTPFDLCSMMQSLSLTKQTMKEPIPIPSTEVIEPLPLNEETNVSEQVSDQLLDEAAARNDSDVAVEKDPKEDMDELLKECFFAALKMIFDKTRLPLLTSTFYSAFVCQQCPENMRLDIKRTSYRKFSTFLDAMCEKGVLEVKETSKGVQSISNVFINHPLVKDFSPTLLYHSVSSTAAVSVPTKLGIFVMEVYAPPNVLLPVFQSTGLGKGSLLSAREIEEAVMAYVKQNHLQSDEQSVVRLDPVLCDVLYRKEKSVTEELNFRDLVERILKLMKPYCSITHGDSKPLTRKGHVKPVVMTVMQRSGNKKVTLVENLDFYGITEDEFAHTAQKVAAASTTVESSPDSTKTRVLVQGNAAKLCIKILQDKYGLPSKFVEIVDKLKPPKKKKGGRR